MTKEQFLKEINRGRYPKYVLSQIKSGKPRKECSAIVLTATGSMLLAKYENGVWQQVHVYNTGPNYPSQDFNWTEIKEKVVYWTSGEARDSSRQQFED
jgi:hypothetical protein